MLLNDVNKGQIKPPFIGGIHIFRKGFCHCNFFCYYRRFFGGKFGQSVIDLLCVEYMSELTKYSQEELQRYFGEKSGYCKFASLFNDFM